MWKLFIRNKFVEFGNLLYSIKESIRDIFTDIGYFFMSGDWKYIVYLVGGITGVYFALCGIGWLSDFLFPALKESASWYAAYPFWGMMTLFMLFIFIGGTILILFMISWLCKAIWDTCSKFLKQNLKLARNGIKVKSKWKKVSNE